MRTWQRRRCSCSCGTPRSGKFQTTPVRENHAAYGLITRTFGSLFKTSHGCLTLHGGHCSGEEATEELVAAHATITVSGTQPYAVTAAFSASTAAPGEALQVRCARDCLDEGLGRKNLSTRRQDTGLPSPLIHTHRVPRRSALLEHVPILEDRILPPS
jgi:hypothetical protein